MMSLLDIIKGKRTGVALGLTSGRIGNAPASILSRLCVVSLILMTIGVGQAWAGTGYAKVIANASPSDKGYVYVGTGTNGSTASASNASDYAENSKYEAFASETNVPFRLCAKAKDGYGFTAWRLSGSSSNASQSNPWDMTVKGGDRDRSGSLWSGYTYTVKSKYTYTYNAIFEAITVNSADSASAISFNHPETKTVTLYFPVSNYADENADFNAPTITANKVWTIKSWNLNTSTHKVEVVCEFIATSDVAKGSYVATVMLKAKSNNSNTGTVTANVDLTPTLTYDNGTCDISVSDADKTILNVTTLLTAYKGADNVAGDGAITYALKSASSVASVTSAGVFYAKALGTYTIVASAAKGRYYAKTAEFDVTVGKRTPTFSWQTPENIYAGDVLSNVAQAQYAGNNVAGLSYSYTSGDTSVVVADGTTLRVQSTGFNTAQTVRITVNTKATDYYLAGSDYHDYYIEPKQTPEFYMNGTEIPAEGAELHLLIGETANFSFDKIENDEAHFTTPQNPQYVSYAHNSTNHTGVLTAKAAGEETILFSQGGTTLINAGSRSVHVYVTRHPVSLATTLDGGTWKVDSVYTGAVYSMTSGDGVHALNTPTVTSSDEDVLKIVDGHWKAVGAGTATLTISHANTDYWAAETVYAHITVEKYTPVITWNLDASYPWGAVIDNPVSSSNTELPFIITSSNPTIANVVNGRIEVYNISGNVTFTLSQPGNYKWADASSNLTATFNCFKPANHVPFTLTAGNYTNYKKTHSGNVTWNSDGFRLGDNGWDEDDDEVIIHFTGIPKTLSFDQQLDKYLNILPQYPDCWVYESASGTDDSWSEIWYSSDKSEYHNGISKSLQPSTRYLKFKYNGSIYCRYKNINVTERKEIVAPASVTFPTNSVDASANTQTINVEWYNVKHSTVTITGTNASFFQLAEDSHEIESVIDDYDDSHELHVTYAYPEGGTHTATLHIESEDGYTADVALSATSNKLTPTITWKENLTPMQRGVNESSPTTSPVTLVYTSSDSTVVDIEDGTLKPLKKGEATITASFDGSADKKYNSTSSSIAITVTDVKVQHINWVQNFKRLKWTDDPELSSKNTPDFDLEATVSYYDADREEEVVLDRTITFTSGNTDVVQVLDGNVLRVVGIGTTTLTAHVDGIADSLYEATAVRDVIVREPSLDCESWVLENESGSINTISSVEFTLDGEADSIYFDAWREAIKVLIEYSSGELYLDEVYANGTTKTIWHNETEKNTHNSYKAPVSRVAKKVKFYTQLGATGYHNFDGVYARRARYVEFEDGAATKSIAFTTEDAKPGVAKTKTFKVNYSNITDQLEFEFKGGENSKFSVLSPSAIGTQCGDHGDATVTVQFLSNDVATYKDTLLIHNLNQTLTVYLSAEVDKHQQQITWEPNITLNTTDNVTFDATTTGSAAGLAVTYVVTDGSDVATVNETTGQLTIIKDGTVTIEARAAGNESYHDATPVSNTFTISKVKSSITAAPTAALMTLPNTSLADCALSGGSASVPGAFAWDDESIDAAYNNAGYKVVFTPENTNWYDTASCVVVVPVSKMAQVITWNFNVSEMYCNATYSFTGNYAATVNSPQAVTYTTSDASIAYVDDSKALRIVNGGEVTITAHCAGNELYYAAEPVAKTLTIHRFVPTIVVKPTAAAMKIGRVLSDATLTGGRAELDGVEVEGSFAWENGNTAVEGVAGSFTRTIIFTPANSNYYDAVTTTQTVVVEKYAPVITANTLVGTTIDYGQAVSLSTLEGSVTATDNVKIPSVEVAGSVVWKDASTTYPSAGSPSHATAVFVPENTDWYNEVDIPNVPLTVNTVVAASYTATTTLIYGQLLSEAVLENTTTGLFGERVNGSVAWATSVDQTALLGIGEHSVAIRFTSGSGNYTDGDGLCAVTVLDGVVFKGSTDNTWGDEHNWQGGNMPDSDDRVTVDADVEITGDVTIGGLTINEGYTVTVKDGATLNLGDQDSYLRDGYGNIHVENGGNLNCGTGKLKVQDFTLDAKLGNVSDHLPANSGQVTGEEALTIIGDAYFELALDPSGECSQGWYDFTVPFPVDALTGITRYDNTTGLEKTIKNEVNYAIMDFSESRRVESGYGWKKFRGVMQPGQCYTITIDDVDNVYRFKKTKNGTFNNTTSETLAYTDGDNPVRGWNGLGNGTMAHIDLSAEGIDKVQIYNHATNSYIPADMNEFTYVVGASYFVQAPAANSILNYVPGTKSAEWYRAPQRNAAVSENTEFKLTLTRDGSAHEADRLYVGASEDALDIYELGYDLAKFGNPTDSKVAQVWANAYGMKLCDIEMPLVSNKAVTHLSLYAPDNAIYTLEIKRAPKDANLYLTYNDQVIWDLTSSAYTIDLTKGTTEGYGLRIETRTPQITTGVDNTTVDTKSARKVLINNTLYVVTPDGEMYDVVGKFVK